MKIHRLQSDLSRAQVEERLRGFTIAAAQEFDFPPPSYSFRGREFWRADVFEAWHVEYLEIYGARLVAQRQWLECEEARMRAELERRDEAERLAYLEKHPNGLTAMLERFKEQLSDRSKGS